MTDENKLSRCDSRKISTARALPRSILCSSLRSTRTHCSRARFEFSHPALLFPEYLTYSYPFFPVRYPFMSSHHHWFFPVSYFSGPNLITPLAGARVHHDPCPCRDFTSWPLPSIEFLPFLLSIPPTLLFDFEVLTMAKLSSHITCPNVLSLRRCQIQLR